MTKRYRVKIRNITMGVPITFLDKYCPKEFVQPDGTTKKFGNICWFTNLPTKKCEEYFDLFEEYSPDKYPMYDNYLAINVDRVSDIPCNEWFEMTVGEDRYNKLKEKYDDDCVLIDGDDVNKQYHIKVRNIVMGVPITFIDKYNPKQFEIVGASVDSKNTFCHIQKDYTKLGYKFFKQDGSVSGSGALRDKMSPKIPVKGKSDYSLAPDGSVLSAVYNRIFIRKKLKKTKRYHIKVRNIVMGVPITFLDKYCPKQFCIIGHEHDLEGTGESEGAVGGQLMVQKKGMYKRILIRKKSK